MITPEDVKLAKVGIEAMASEAFKPVAGLIEKVFGGVAEDLGHGWRATTALWALKRELRFWKEAQRIIAEAGFTPKAVPPPILIPIIQNASIQDDDSLQDRWAALLANAANPDLEFEILPSYPEKLKQLSPIDARILDWMYDKMESAKQAQNIDYPGIPFREIQQTFCQGLPVGDYHIEELRPLDILNEVMRHQGYLTIHLDNILGLRLIMLRPKDLLSLGDMMPVEPLAGDDFYELTPLGEAFMKACRPPAPRTNSMEQKEA